MEHALSAAELLNVWEQARSLAPAEGALSVLALADPETPRDQLAQLIVSLAVFLLPPFIPLAALRLAFVEDVFEATPAGPLRKRGNLFGCGMALESFEDFDRGDVRLDARRRPGRSRVGRQTEIGSLLLAGEGTGLI